MAKTYTLTVFNTCTSQYEDIEVTEDVYNEFRRGEWRIAKNEDKHIANETSFSNLIGGEDRAYENFSEFVDDSLNPEILFAGKMESETLYTAIRNLPEPDYKLIHALFFEGLTEREYAELQGVAQPTVHWKKIRILKYLKKYFL